MTAKQGDIWAEWLAERRSGGDAEARRQVLERLGGVRDKLLDRAELSEGQNLLDVGCGEGLIGFGALERGVEHVVFSDISDDLLQFCRETAEALGLRERCSFVRAGADDLAEIPDTSVDVLTTRAVLIFVEDKERAFAEFFRVLRPGGRISLYEPINSFAADQKDCFWAYPSDGLSHLAERLEHVFTEIQPPSDPMLDFDERDLMRFAEQAGFFPIELELMAEIRPIDPVPWHVFLNTAGNPKVPTFAEAMDRVLTPQERKQVAEHLRPLVEQGRGVWRMAYACLTGVKQ